MSKTNTSCEIPPSLLRPEMFWDEHTERPRQCSAVATIHHDGKPDMGPQRRKGRSPATVQFIQIQTPGKATSSSLSLIRSHVARRQRTRKSKIATTKVVRQDDEETPARHISAKTVAPRATAHGLKAQPRTPTTLVPYGTALPPSPSQLIGSSKNDAPHVFAGRFSVDEQFLFDFCTIP